MKRFVTLILTVAIVGMTAPAFAVDYSILPESADYGLRRSDVSHMPTSRKDGKQVDSLKDGSQQPTSITDQVVPTFLTRHPEEVPRGEGGS